MNQSLTFSNSTGVQGFLRSNPISAPKESGVRDILHIEIREIITAYAMGETREDIKLFYCKLTKAGSKQKEVAYLTDAVGEWGQSTETLDVLKDRINIAFGIAGVGGWRLSTQKPPHHDNNECFCNECLDDIWEEQMTELSTEQGSILAKNVDAR